VGTEFAVSHRKDELLVTVSEGLVRVAPRAKSTKSSAADDGPLELSVPIGADQELRIGGTWPVTPTRIDVRYALAWRDGQLRFQRGDTLADAVEEFNLRNRLQLRIDARASTLPVRGSFPASDPVAFTQAIDRDSPVAVRRVAANTLLIQAE
jgi:ferric-dicitrate binding protein FerR (iron transport regulator)